MWGICPVGQKPHAEKIVLQTRGGGVHNYSDARKQNSLLVLSARDLGTRQREKSEEMSESAAHLRAIARRLAAYEAAESKSSEPDAPATFAVCEKLRGPLARLSGINGYRSLLSRALALAGKEVRWLQAVHIKADGSLECPAELADLDPQEITVASISDAAAKLRAIQRNWAVYTPFLHRRATLVQQQLPKVSAKPGELGTPRRAVCAIFNATSTLPPCCNIRYARLFEASGLSGDSLRAC